MIATGAATSLPLVVASNRVFPETRALFAGAARLVAPEGDAPFDRARLLAELRGADALMAFMTDRVDAGLIADCPRLRVIGAALKGYDNIDIEAATRAGVWVSIVPDLLTAPTAELAIALMLALGRHVSQADAEIRAHGFRGWRPRLYGAGIEGATVGIVGYGAVGRAIARRLAGFGCRIVVCDPARVEAGEGAAVERVALAALLDASDWVVLAAPLTAATLGLIDAGALARMKPGARLVNPARGSLVDEDAVAAALASGRLAGYAADVFACEDWARPDRPASIPPALRAPGAPTVLTPHIGSAVVEARRGIERATAANILAALAGRRPADAVNEPARAVTC